MPNSPAIDQSHQWRSFWVAAAVGAMTILDLSKINVALPAIESSLNASATDLQFIVSGYILAFGLTLVPMGRLGDQRSRKTLFLVGLTGFAVTSAICAMAPNATILIIGRLLQGVAAGIQMPQVIGTIQQVFKGPSRGRAFGLFGSVIGISTAFGPTLGGLLVAVGDHNDGWRWVFWTNVPLALLVIVAVIFFLPETSPHKKTAIALDPVGIVIFGLTVLTFLGPFLLTTGAPTDDPRRWWLLVPAVIFGVVFVWWEGRYALQGKAPLIPLKLFRVPSFRNGTVVIAGYFSAMPAMFLLTTLFLQIGVGIKPVYAGMVSIGFALTSAVSAWIGGNLVDRYGRLVVVTGLVIVVVGTVALGVIGYAMPVHGIEWAMAGALALAGFGGGFVVAPNQALTLSHVPIADGGLAGSVGQLGQRVGTAIGSAVGLSLFYATIYHEAGSTNAQLPVFRDAYVVSMAAVVVFAVAALVMAILDMRARHLPNARTGDE